MHIQPFSVIDPYKTMVARWTKDANNKDKEAQLSLTNPRDACEKFVRLRKSSGVVSCIASLPIDSLPMVFYYVLYSNCVCKMHRFGDTRLLKLP